MLFWFVLPVQNPIAMAAGRHPIPAPVQFPGIGIGWNWVDGESAGEKEEGEGVRGGERGGGGGGRGGREGIHVSAAAFQGFSALDIDPPELAAVAGEPQDGGGGH